MSEYLLAIALGPVQEFIAAARRTRDLWFGSELLSTVARAAALELRAAGAQLIFPSPHALDRDAAVANKLLAVVEGDPAVLSGAARGAATRRLQELAADAVRRRGDLVVDRDLLDRQIEDFLEYYAAWVPLLAGAYADARAAVERLLAGRKALRDFGPAHGRDGVPKSALDPSRESVLDWRGWPSSRQPPAGTHVREQLDGVSLVKRLAPARRFVSVSRVALDPLIRRLEATDPAGLGRLRELAVQLEGTGAVERLREAPQYDAFPFDTELFYGEDDRVPEAQQAIAREFRREARGALKAAQLTEAPTYYAVLHADGDRMGQLIGTCTTIDEHQELSDRLVEFADDAGRIVVGHQGALVYSGGDDVLAFLPLDRALEAADKLRQAFTARVALTGGRPATLTVGIAIAHYLEPLSDVLEWARAAEHAGKQLRNALAVALHTRAGRQATRVVSSWSTEPVERWSRWIALHRADAVPGRAGYELRRLATELAGLPDAAQVAQPEAKRILQRKRAEHGTRSLAAKGEQQETVLHLLLQRVAPRDGGADALGELARELIIARRLADAVELAGGGR